LVKNSNSKSKKLQYFWRKQTGTKYFSTTLAPINQSQEEDKLKIMWGPADIERWLQTGKRSSSTQRAIEIDSYEVTIFPAESVKVGVAYSRNFFVTFSLGKSTFFREIS
jgi:hypothetical protein